jgi:glycosyltransferase involved in cell wall biosynthesis
VNTPWHIAIVIPARDEQEMLPRCLRSVQNARQVLPSHITTDLIVVADQSTDDTFKIAQDFVRRNGVVVETDAGCVGAARALGTQRALQRYRGAPNLCWLANTDADCQVPATWLKDQLAFANAGLAAVAGIVAVDSFAEHEAFVSERFYRSYLIHADGTHPHVHGANLGVRADAYLQAGGWQDLSTAEYHDLWMRLQNGRHKRVSDAGLCVLTSGRRIGRAPLGFAGALAAHNGFAG